MRVCVFADTNTFHVYFIFSEFSGPNKKQTARMEDENKNNNNNEKIR